jgi:hypothetical protein
LHRATKQYVTDTIERGGYREEREEEQQTLKVVYVVQDLPEKYKAETPLP